MLCNMILTILLPSMLQDYMGKIRNCLDDNPNINAYPLETFYCALKCLSQGIPASEITHVTIDRFSTIYNFIKNETKIQSTLVDRKKLVSELSDFILPFRKYLVLNDVNKAIMIHFDNMEFLENIDKNLVSCRQLINLYAQKKNKIHINGNNQLSFIFWITKFKADYAVHFDPFWTAFVQFLSNSPFYQAFVSQSSKAKIKQIVDPHKKHYVNSANSSDLFRQLSEPSFLKILAEETSLKHMPAIFVTERTLVLKFRKSQEKFEIQTKLSENEEIFINGEQVKFGGNTIPCKYLATIRFGSLLDSQIFIKHDYISRRQFMLIEEDLGFSLVCISPSNFTSVTYPYQVKVKVGMIFRLNNQLIQITKNSDVFNGFMESIEGDQEENDIPDKTLEYLPENKSFTVEKQIQYKYLTGNRKNEKRTLNAKNTTLQFTNASIPLEAKDEDFYLPPNVEILAKTANQVISGHLSEKILLEKGMKIVLEGIQFLIVQC